MPDCDYCGASFDSETEELKHLKTEHREELGRIDKRRVGDVDVDDGGLPTGPIALGAVILLSAAVVGYVVFIAGSGGAAADEPTAVGSVHVHGTMEAVIDGEEIDFEAPEYAENDNAFHFHQGYHAQYGEHIYHVHAQEVTLQYALSTLGMEVNGEGTVLEFGETTYDDSDPDTTVEITVNGDPVAPGEHVLQGVGPEDQAAQGDGDSVRIVVET